MMRAAARARRQGPDLRRRRRRPEGRRRVARRRRDVQHRPELLLGRAHLRPRAHARRVRRRTSSRPCAASGRAIRLAEGTYIGPLTRAPQLDGARSAGRRCARARARRCVAGGKRVARRRATGSSRPCSPTSTTRWRLMREESFGPIIGIQKVASDDEALALMNDTRYGLTAGVYTRDEARARDAARPRQRRQRLLELLRPRQPAPAVVGPRRLGRRRDAVDLRHPDVHAAARLAPAVGVSGVAERRLALFDLDGHAARRRHRRALVRVPDRGGRSRPRALRRAQPRRRRALRARRDHAGRLLPASTRRRSPAAARVEWAPLRERFVASAIVPRIGTRRARWSRSTATRGDRLVLTTATNRFLTEPIAAVLGISELVATELEVAANGRVHRAQRRRRSTCATAR